MKKYYAKLFTSSSTFSGALYSVNPPVDAKWDRIDPVVIDLASRLCFAKKFFCCFSFSFSLFSFSYKSSFSFSTVKIF